MTQDDDVIEGTPERRQRRLAASFLLGSSGVSIFSLRGETAQLLLQCLQGNR